MNIIKNNYDRSLDIKIALLIGHYREKGIRGWYDKDTSVSGGSMAMAIFNKPVHSNHQFDDLGNRRWWKDESYIGDDNEKWYTSAVPLYQESLIESFELLYLIQDQVDIAIHNIGYFWNISIQNKINCDIRYSCMDEKLPKAICNVFILYKEKIDGI